MQVIKRRSKVFKKNMSLGRSLKFLKTIGPQEFSCRLVAKLRIIVVFNFWLNLFKLKRGILPFLTKSVF